MAQNSGLFIASNTTITRLELYSFQAGLVNIQENKPFSDTEEGYLAWLLQETYCMYCQTYKIRGSKSRRAVPNPLKLGVKSRMKL